MVLEKADSGGVGPFVLKSDGLGAGMLYARGPASPTDVAQNEGFCIVMDGREVFKFAVRAMEDATRQAISDAGLTLTDIDYVVPHQANQRIISAVGKAMDLAPGVMISNVERYGNTSSASIPVALCEAWEEGRFKEGDRIAFVAFGGGLVWGASLLEWTGIGSHLATSSIEAAQR